MDQIHNEIRRLQNLLKDQLDDRESDISRNLQEEIQRLEDEAEMNKHPKTLESRVNSVIDMLEEGADAGVLDHHDADEFVDQFREIIQKLRKL